MDPPDNQPFEDETPDYGDAEGAPRYPIPSRELSAIEVPAFIQNVDRAVKAFGRVPDLSHTLDPQRHSIPLYLNPESPFCRPLFSHNARTHNVVLKVTAPKRTGRKRKKGSNGPWQGDVEVTDAADQDTKVSSFARQDDPKLMRRQLADNADKYRVDAVGIVKHTHRFRALSDFYWDLEEKSDLANRYVDKVLPGDIDQVKDFKFVPGIDKGPNIDIIPPPVFTHQSLPFNYFYQQNPYVRFTEDGQTFNATAVKHVGHFIAADAPTPMAPQHPPDMTDVRTVEAMADLEAAFAERPVWTRRALMNHLRKGSRMRTWNELKLYLNYAAYQFKGGPWRDSVMPYGFDPRIDPQYRIYQTVMFKLVNKSWQTTAMSDMDVWYSLHGDKDDPDNDFEPDFSKSHLFDGQTYHLDGKVWQICDIVDPLLKGLVEKASIRPERHPISGWYHGGTWAQLKAIMKIKLLAIRFGRHLQDEQFALTLNTGDKTPNRSGQATQVLPLPKLDLTPAERTELRGPARHHRPAVRQNYSARVRTGPDENQMIDPELRPAEGGDFLEDEAGDSDDGSENDEDEGDEGEGVYEYPDF